MAPEILPEVHTCFEKATGTWQYIVADPQSRDAVIIDSVLDFDPAIAKVTTTSADELLALVAKHDLKVQRIMETHTHADHLTASYYLQQQLHKSTGVRPAICIGKRIKQVQATFASRYGVPVEELDNVFDKLWDDNEEFTIGSISCSVLHLPGHTPDHVGYLIGPNVFAGDVIFNPDVGSARADFPGGDVTALWSSGQKLLVLPKHYRLYVGHDYPPDSRVEDGSPKGPMPYTTVEEQNKANKHLKSGTQKEEFTKWRAERDARLADPRLLAQALQVNIRGGRMPRANAAGLRLLHVSVKLPENFEG